MLLAQVIFQNRQSLKHVYEVEQNQTLRKDPGYNSVTGWFFAWHT